MDSNEAFEKFMDGDALFELRHEDQRIQLRAAWDAALASVRPEPGAETVTTWRVEVWAAGRWRFPSFWDEEDTAIAMMHTNGDLYDKAQTVRIDTTETVVATKERT